MKTVENRYKRNQNDRGNIRFSRQTWEDFYKCSAGKNVYLFGAGNACDEFLYEYAGKVNINGILENDIQKVGKEKEKLPIILYSDFQAKKNDTVILITSIQYDDEIGKILFKDGYKYVFSIYSLEVNKKYKKKGILKKAYDILFAYHFGFFSSHNYFYNYILFHILACLRIMHFPPAYLPYKGLKRYKNIHKGERCFIVATGPSLKLEDIELLYKNHEYTFSMNSIFNLFDQTLWRPDYYVLEDPKFNIYFNWSDEKYNLDKACKKTAFLTYMYRKNCKKFKKVQFYPISFLGHLEKHDDTHMIFSKNFIWGIYCAYTVTNVCIQLAQYMGFEKVYLLGVDCNYQGSSKHFSKEIDDEKYTEKYARQVYDNLIRGYTFIGEHVKKLGTTVYNATRGGSLEVFERVALEDLFTEDSKN